MSHMPPKRTINHKMLTILMNAPLKGGVQIFRNVLVHSTFKVNLLCRGYNRPSSTLLQIQMVIFMATLMWKPDGCPFKLPLV